MKNHDTSDFNRKSFTSIPFGGPLWGRLKSVNSSHFYPLLGAVIGSMSVFPHTDLSAGILAVLLILVDPSMETADNFYARAHYFVHVAFAALQRQCSVASFLQKNIMVSLHVYSKAHLILNETAGSLLRASSGS